MSLPDDPYVQSVYNDLIEEFYVEDIDTWNVYLETCGLPMLGSSNSSEAEYNHGYMIEELKKLEWETWISFKNQSTELNYMALWNDVFIPT